MVANKKKEELECLRSTGNIPVANLKIFDSIRKLQYTDYVLDHVDYTITMYKEYLERLNSMSEDEKAAFLRTIKIAEVIDNHSLEKEDSFLIALYLEQFQQNSIDYLLENSTDSLKRQDFIDGHKLLLKGTKCQKYALKDYRTDNSACVGKILPGGERKITYFSIPYTDIEKAISKLLDLYNSDDFDQQILLKPQIIHGIVAALQMFDDGNTRYARILQNIKLYDLTKKQLDKSLEAPILYGTRSYFVYRGKYRELINSLVVSPDNDNWNRWFDFNLNRVEDQMYFLNDKIEQYKRLVNK